MPESGTIYGHRTANQTKPRRKLEIGRRINELEFAKFATRALRRRAPGIRGLYTWGGLHPYKDGWIAKSGGHKVCRCR